MLSNLGVLCEASLLWLIRKNINVSKIIFTTFTDKARRARIFVKAQVLRSKKSLTFERAHMNRAHRDCPLVCQFANGAKKTKQICNIWDVPHFPLLATRLRRQSSLDNQPLWLALLLAVQECFAHRSFPTASQSRSSPRPVQIHNKNHTCFCTRKSYQKNTEHMPGFCNISPPRRMANLLCFVAGANCNIVWGHSACKATAFSLAAVRFFMYFSMSSRLAKILPMPKQMRSEAALIPLQTYQCF